MLVTGSSTGLGAGAARELLGLGHDVVLHARNQERAARIGNLTSHAIGIVIGDLSSREETSGVADQVNAIGGVDSVIHNATIYADADRVATPEGHARSVAVNVFAPYLVTAWIERQAGSCT